MKALIFILAVMMGTILGGVMNNKPLMILYNDKGEIVATGSTSVDKAQSKASFLPPGVYTLVRPDVTITVFADNRSPVAVTGGDIDCTVGELCYLPGCDLSYDLDGTIVSCVIEQTSGVPIEILHDAEGKAYFITPNNDPEV